MKAKPSIQALAPVECRRAYNLMSNGAANHERAREWAQAAAAWDQALTFATKDKDRAHCRIRADFCVKQIRREVRHG